MTTSHRRVRRARPGVLAGLFSAAFFAVGGALLGSPEAAAAGSLTSITSKAGSDHTRIVIEVGQTTKYRYGTVQANPAKKLPARLFIDLSGVRIGKSRKHDLWVGDTRVSKVRTGQFTDDTTRVVLELEGAVTPKVYTMSAPPRIIVDIQGKGSTATAVAKKKPVAVDSAGKTQVAKATPPTAAKATPPTAAKATPPTAAKAAPAKTPANTVSKKPVAEVKPSRPAASSPVRRKRRVVIDPGHGGRDPGAKGYRGSSEKSTVVDISRRLAKKLKDRLGVEVIMTRQDDRYVSLAERKDAANRVDADLFISVHANASENSKLRGIETYYLKNSNDRATLRLAKLENGVDLLIKGQDVSKDADLSYILSDMVQGQKEVDSILLANHIQDELVGYLNPRYHSVRSLGVKQGPFMVLDGTYMPAVLVEVGFISNSLEGQRLTMSGYRDAVAEGLYRGVKRYLGDERVVQVR